MIFLKIFFIFPIFLISLASTRPQEAAGTESMAQSLKSHSTSVVFSCGRVISDGIVCPAHYFKLRLRNGTTRCARRRPKKAKIEVTDVGIPI